jgi:predicted amidohydrolase YtcJ
VLPLPLVLQVAAINASKQLRWSQTIGIMKKGFLADIIAVDNDLGKHKRRHECSFCDEGWENL